MTTLRLIRSKAPTAAVAKPIASSKPFTVAESREVVTAAFRALGAETMRSLVDVDNIQREIFDRITTNGTILSAAVAALNAVGNPTQSTVGAVRAKLGMSQDDVDVAFCEGLNGTEMTGNLAVVRMEALTGDGLYDAAGENSHG